MSDTTYSRIHCRSRSVERFRELGYEIECEHEGVAELLDTCANYGNAEELKALSAEGFAFAGQHGPGDEYGCYVQASTGRRFVEVPADQEGFPVARVLSDGKVDRKELAEARKYWRAYSRVERMFRSREPEDDA